MFKKLRSAFSKEKQEMSLSSIEKEMQSIQLGELREKEGVEKAASQLEQQIKALAETKGDDDYANVVKNRFVKNILSFFNEVPQDAQDFINHHSHLINELSGISSKEFRQLHAFKEDMKKIAACMRSLENAQNKLVHAYTVSKEKRKRHLSSKLRELKESRNSLEMIEKELAEIEKSLPFIKESKEKDERRMSEKEKLLQGIRKDLENDLEDIDKKRGVIKQRISTDLGMLSSQMKKLDHSEPGRFRLLSDYAANAGSTFMQDDFMEIKDILQALTESADSEEKKKIQDIMSDLDIFASLREEYLQLTEQRKEAMEKRSEELEKLEKDRSNIKIDVDQKEGEIEHLLEKRKKKQEEKDITENRIKMALSDIERTASDLFEKDIIISKSQ